MGAEANERLLVLDGDGESSRAIAHVLSTAGYTTLTSSDPIEALSIIDQQPPDMVIVDLRLADRSGVDFCRAVRSDTRLPADVPVLIVSPTADGSVQNSAIDAGADDYLVKPIHRGELILRVRSLLQLRRARRELARSNEVLVQQRDSLLRLSRQKEELMEVVVHDLKNPLAAIVSNANYLTHVQGLDEDALECAKSISRASENMLRMVHNLLDLARSEDAGMSLRYEQLDLAALAQRTVSLMSHRAEERRVNVSFSAEGEEHSIEADADMLRRVLENLLDNAIRYSPKGGQVQVSVGNLGLELALSVADTGAGIAPEHRTHIFEKYAQLDRDVDRSQRGFGRGIGLAFVKTVVDAHRGRIWIEDNQPSGARFEIRLPRVRAD
jgi:two-component system sensor histidine kinase/response regulator